MGEQETTMQPQTGYSALYEEALRLAARAHRDQMRKTGGVPYVTHPVHVSMILARYGFSEEVLAAALLHDVVEDQDVTLDEIEEQFGAHVAEIVDVLTEQKLDGEGNRRPWEIRKREAVAHMRQASEEAAAVKVADTIHNARSILRDMARDGTKIWDKFNRGPEAQIGYYRRILAAGREQLPGHPLVGELADVVAELAAAVDTMTTEEADYE
jgi:(p)ppGpp synthase/HD superfamily hydrolase